MGEAKRRKQLDPSYGKPKITIQTQADFILRTMAIAALNHSAPGVAIKATEEAGLASVQFLPKEDVTDPGILKAIEQCDFTKQRVLHWDDRNGERTSFIVPIERLEQMSQAMKALGEGDAS